MRLTFLFFSIIVPISLFSNIVEAKGIGDLFANNTSKVCNSTGNKGTLGCPVNQGAGIVDTLSVVQGGGNPINVLTGNKFEQATDIQAVGDDYALKLNRYYNSRSSQRGMLGIGWRHDYEMQLQDTDNTIDIIQADGRQIHFQKTAAALGNSSLFVTRYVADKSELGYIERTQSLDPTKAAWLWTLPTGKQFQFIAHRQTDAVNQLGQHRFGQLSRVTEKADDPSSPYWALTYGTDGTLAQVRNYTGDTLKFTYDTTASGLPKISVTSSSRNKASTGKWVYLLDQNNNLAQVVSPTAIRTGYQYNDPNDKHNLTEKFGYDKTKPQLITQWQYDAYDRATSSSHKDGIEKVSVVFDKDTVLPTQAGHIFTNTLTNSVGETTDYRYQYKNGEAQLLSVIGTGCVTCGPSNISYEYDSAGRVTQTSQLDGQGQTVLSTATSYDTLGRTTKVAQTNEEDTQTWLAYGYDNVDHPMLPTSISRPSVVEGKTSQTKLSYDALGNITAMTEMGYQPATATSQAQSISRTTTYQYEKINGKSQLTSVDGPLQGSKDTTYYQYDKQNQLTLISYPEGLTQQMSYDAQGRVTTLVNIDGTTNHYQYNAQGQVTQSDQAGQVSQINYDPLGRIQQVTDPLGQILNYQYDASGQIIGMGDGKQAQIDLTRDTEGNLTAANLLVDGKVEQQTAFETLDNTTKQQLLATIKVIAEDGQSNNARPEVVINPFEKIAALINQSPTIIQSQIEQTDAQGLITTYTADDFGNIVEVSSPTTGVSSYQYDANRLLIGSQSPLNAQTYQRDNIGRIIGITVSSTDGNTEQHNVEWGKHNKPIKVTYPTGQESFSYNENAQLLTHTQQVDNQSFTLTYSYDDKGRVQSKTLPDGNVIKYTYNGDEKKKVGVLNGIYLKGIWDKPIITGLNSDSDTSLIQRFNFGNGISNLVQKDQNGRIVLAGNPKVGQTALNYDPNQKQLEPEQVTQTHSGQMGEAIQPQSTVSQQVRTVLDQVLYNQNPEPLTVSQNDIIEQISQAPEIDQWGRTVRQGDQHYEYDSQNRLTKISATDESGKLIPIADYRYNTFNQRIAKTTYNNQGNTTKTTYYFYDGNQLIAETIDAAAQTANDLKQYIWLNDTPIAILEQDELYYIHTDHRNAPIAVTDNISKLVWQADNEDFGYANINAKSTFELNLRLSNQYYDSESGLHYNTNRYYDALNQQYLTPDPLGLAAGPDLFAFALNQPHSVSDPDGLYPDYHKKSVSLWSAEEKFEYVISKASEKFIGDVRQALRDLISSPGVIATTALIFTVYAAAQATPIGWVADVAVFGLAAWYIGTAAFNILEAIVDVGKVVLFPCNIGDLNKAVDSMVAGIKGAIEVVGAVAAVTKIPKILKSLTSKLPKVSPSIINSVKNKTKNSYVAPIKFSSLSDLAEKAFLLGPKVKSSTGRNNLSNDGALGESVAKNILEAATGAKYRGIQNGSGNGPDLIRINKETKTIEHVEVKSKMPTSNPNTHKTPVSWPDGKPDERFRTWILEARTGKISGKSVSKDDREYAEQIYQLLYGPNATYTLDNKVMQVVLPKINETGNTIAKLFKWTGSTKPSERLK